MYCTNCYHFNSEGVRYCAHCGARLQADSRPAVAVWTADAPDDTTAGAQPGDSSGDYGEGAGWGQGVQPPYYGTVVQDATPRSRRRGLLGRLLAPLAPVVFLLSKLQGLIFLAKFGKLGLTAVTMLVSVVAYAAAWQLSWAAAIGFVVLLFIHEMGHWVVMRLKGVPASVPIFIPFLGAVINMRGMPRSVKDEAEIGIAGPIAGTAGALACLGLANLYGGHLWPLLGAIGLFLNLFNLLPVSPLDGGRIVAAISRWLWIAGLVGLVALFFWWHNPFLLFIGLIGGAETIARFRGRFGPTAKPGYYALSALQRITFGVMYFGLIALIVLTLLNNPAVSLS
jgi:Zn-dependent protease